MGNVNLRRCGVAHAVLAALTGLTLARGTDRGSARGEDLWEQSRAAYAKLQSYADSGTILTESRSPGAPTVVERHSFTTYYRAPRQFYFDFRKDPKAGKERLVIWCDGEDFQSWWSATGVHQTYPKGTGASAFGTASFPTKGSVVLIPPLLFSQAGLQGPLTVFKPRQSATEELNGVKVHKLIGEVAMGYATGRGAHPRPTTVWIDAQTLLVRKVVEDTPAESPEGSLDRVTATFEPRANPQLADSVFRFAVPSDPR